ncbi:hypothetical protein [Telluria aromaticivorans]|uniref:Uncharacterized protein n=1 Tax=Telluria aromaticivorans TaxID=2725995 RepID=A0A7Y2P2I8_9BURK|nr:hypothetical protein [Telluria aromaticivorans]NNG24989.1 hypothetical protein [Telluria aromaticivorans]
MSPLENKKRKEIIVRSSNAQIDQIFFIDGSDNSKAKSVSQFVNLSRSANFVDGSIVRSLDRVGYSPRVKICFDRPGNHHFTVKCLPLDGNAKYSSEELARNARFKWQSEPKSYTTDSGGSLILPAQDFYVSAAGHDRYFFQATDDSGKTITTGNLEVQRLIYYIELKMRSLSTCAKDLSIAQEEYTKHNIKLLKLPSVEMTYMPNIGHDEKGKFLDHATTAFRSSDAVNKAPHVIAIAYTGQLAVKKDGIRMLETSIQVGPNATPVIIQVKEKTPSSPLPEHRFLWKGLTENDSWFVSARFVKEGGKLTDVIQIPLEKCSALPMPETSQSSMEVSIDVSDLPKAIGSIELIVNVVDKMRAGMAFGGMNLICVCTMAWWETIEQTEQNQIIIHELGHKIGMVADGRRKLPDKPPTWYDNEKGHVGDHCFHGLPANRSRYDLNGDEKQSKCIMYGTTNGRSDFCINCAPIVRKLDISEGWDPL